MPKLDKYGEYLVLGITACTAINVLLSYIVSRCGLPLYFDSIGIVLITMIGGVFPGIITAVATNLLCGLFNSDSMYYAFIGVSIALCTSYFFKSGKKNRIFNQIVFVIVVSIICGVLGTSFQWILKGQPQFEYVSDITKVLAGDNKLKFFTYSMLLIVGLNIVDKGFCITVAAALTRIIPLEIRKVLKTGGLKQKPLTKAEIERINLQDGGTSLRVKMIFMLLSVSLGLTVILSIVSTSIKYEEDKNDGREIVSNVTAFAAQFLHPESFDNFLRDGVSLKECSNPYYIELNNMLLNIKDSVSYLDYLYVYKIREDGCYIVFDTDEEFQKNGVVGEKIEFDESYLDLVPDLLEGKRIEVQEKESRYGYFITAYEPLYDKSGRPTTYYVGADISLKKYASYVRKYAVKLLLVFSGFFALILAYGIWMSDNTLLYPIGSLEKSIEDFMKGIGEQEKLDDIVRSLQKLDIRTDDEVEKLYKLLCEMAVGTTEQMRSIRMLAKSNLKMQAGLMITMADIVANRDFEAKAHVQRIVAYVRIIMDGLKSKGYYAEKLTVKFMNDVEISAPLYDIGKINVPDAILKKPGKLTDSEFEIIKTHTTAGQKILENAISTVEGENYLKEARNMATYHHERWDGSGYPEGLHGQVIPLSARIMAVADVFDALTSERVYKKAFPLEKSIEIMKEGSGTQFDPKCVEVFLDQINEVKKVMKKYQ